VLGPACLGPEDGGALVMARYGHPSSDAARARLLAFGRQESILNSLLLLVAEQDHHGTS
jgi:hypothetical protein